jgi:glutamate racemase
MSPVTGPTPIGPTIGVFDSGFGGLTVLRALLPLIPGANYIYLGDTARLPYGAKSQQTIARYAVSSSAFLHDQGAQMLVIACNTATALALPEIEASLPIPVVGVVRPGAEAARTAGNSDVLILATSATVQSGAYTRACAAVGLRAYEKPCPLLVPLVEEGWIDHPVTAQVLRIYLTEALSEAPTARTLLLGCTHYPMLRAMIERTLAELHHPMHIVDSAATTAHAAASLLSSTSGIPTALAGTTPTCTFFATDSVEKFQRLGGVFLGRPLPEVALVDLGG